MRELRNYVALSLVLTQVLAALYIGFDAFILFRVHNLVPIVASGETISKQGSHDFPSFLVSLML